MTAIHGISATVNTISRHVATVADDVRRTSNRLDDGIATALGSASQNTPVGKPSLVSRVIGIITGKADKAVSRMENPAQLLNQATDELISKKDKLKEAMKEVSKAKHKLDAQGVEMQNRHATLNDNIERAMKIASSSTDEAEKAQAMRIARSSMSERSVLELRMQEHVRHLGEAEQWDKQIIEDFQKVEAELADFAIAKEMLVIQHQAVSAVRDIKTSATGLNGAKNSAAYAMGRVKDEVASMKAEIGAIDELSESGVLRDVLAGDPMKAQLMKMASQEHHVDAELAAFAAERGLSFGDAVAPAAEAAAKPIAAVLDDAQAGAQSVTKHMTA